MATPFDIRTKLNPPYGQLPPGKAEPEDQYDQINLMCLLLDGLKYKDLYSGRSLAKICEHMRNRIHGEDAAALLPRESIQQADTILAEMIAWLSQHRPTLSLRALYEAVQSGDVEANVVDPMRELMRLSGNRLCLPFMAVQDRVHTIRPNEMAQHVLDIGDFDYRQLHELSGKKHPKLVAAIKSGRAGGILNTPRGYLPPGGRGRPGRLVPVPEGGGGGGNWRKCDATHGCVDSTQNTFCNIAADGSCSTVSG